MVFGLLNVLETFFGFIFWIIPYWDWVRMGFFIWLLLPNFNGAKIIYESGIKPFMETNKDIIHEWINKLKSVASDAADEAKKAASDPTLIAKAAVAANQAQAAVNEKLAETDEPSVQTAEN